MVRRLDAGGKGIQTLGPAVKERPASVRKRPIAISDKSTATKWCSEQPAQALLTKRSVIPPPLLIRSGRRDGHGGNESETDGCAVAEDLTGIVDIGSNIPPRRGTISIWR